MNNKFLSLMPVQGRPYTPPGAFNLTAKPENRGSQAKKEDNNTDSAGFKFLKLTPEPKAEAQGGGTDLNGAGLAFGDQGGDKAV